MTGHTLIELLAAMSVLLVILAAAVPTMTRAAGEARTRGAAFYMASRITMLRIKAVNRSANIALRFEPQGNTWIFREFGDGDWDGVRSVDIASGRDYAIGEPEQLGHSFRGVEFGFLAGCPLIDGQPVSSGMSPVRIGNASMISFSPAGTATSGSLYLRGEGATAYAVVVLGATGRTRVLRCTPHHGVWTEHGR